MLCHAMLCQDMFHSMHSVARMHAIARVISGEPDCSQLPALLCLPSGGCRLPCAGPHHIMVGGSAVYLRLLRLIRATALHPTPKPSPLCCLLRLVTQLPGPPIPPTNPPGGPIYISDKPGHHDFHLLRRLVLPDGSGGQYKCMMLEPFPEAHSAYLRHWRKATPALPKECCADGLHSLLPASTPACPAVQCCAACCRGAPQRTACSRM